MHARRALALSLLVSSACGGGGAAATGTAPRWPESLDAPSTDASHRAAALALIEASVRPDLLRATIENEITAQLEHNPEMAPFAEVMREFVAEWFRWEVLRDALADVYVERFSELELRQLAAFYRTPLGERLAAEMPSLAAEHGRIGRQIVNAHQDDLVRRMQARAAELGAASPPP
jgi:hypothetical protein